MLPSHPPHPFSQPDHAPPTPTKKLQVMTAGFASIAGGVMAVPWEAKTEVPWELKHHVQSGALEGPHLLTFTYHRGRWNHST